MRPSASAILSAMRAWRNPEVRQFIRFAIVGVAQNGTNLAVFALAIALGVPYLLAAVIAAVIALSLSFALNRRWTFPGTNDRSTGRAIRFVAVWLGFLALALPTLALLVEVAHMPRVLSQAIIIFVGAPLSYLIQRRWTFRQDEPKPRNRAISPARPSAANFGEAARTSADAPVAPPPRAGRSG
jgi:putative flippase GtrA